MRLRLANGPPRERRKSLRVKGLGPLIYDVIVISNMFLIVYIKFYENLCWAYHLYNDTRIHDPEC